ncbi:Transcriptional regulator/sugar kinase [Candidatus Desulfarcum epimagneticum]|uniref:Transcriptional regulator/sugar kinase n=1 Tax=uncultured Desulfobacteraceae bacterium TaxID=218296 RepID=A0A484HL99_9BACT|nr:Transcriptional regulator/sugar kinase [uncultured Desulfobacteraceae bacterium]
MWPRILLIIVIAMAVTAGAAYWALSSYVFVKEFEPHELSAKEKRVLDAKLKAVGVDMGEAGSRSRKSEPLKIKEDEYLIPQPYSEKGAGGEISFNEREVNALLAKNTNLGKKLAIDLANDLVSAKLLIPMEPDFPILGGKTIRVNAGVELAYKNGKPIVRLKGVSLWGAPIPNVWLGNLKNVDLASKFGDEQGFWKSFSEGVKNIRVEEGQMKITLKK